MKYVKPELKVVRIETQPIASAGLANWLINTQYSGAENYITNFQLSS